MRNTVKKLKTEYEYVNCNICGKDTSYLLFRGKDREFGLGGEFTWVKCQNCGLVYLNPRPTMQAILQYYPETYTPHTYTGNAGERGGYRKKSFFKKLIRPIYDVYLHFLVPKDLWSLDDLPIGKVIDIGCGGGAYLNMLRHKGWEAFGVDIHPKAISIARRLGLNVFEGQICQSDFISNFFDVVVMKNSLEHMHSPLHTLKEVYRVLKDDGILIIETPNIASLEARLFRTFWHELDTPRHLYLFTPATLKILMSKAGFDVVKTAYDCLPDGIIKSLDFATKKRITKALNIFLKLSFPIIANIERRIGKGFLVIRARKQNRR